MKRLPGTLLFILGVLLIYNTFSDNPVQTSWSMLFSFGGILMLVGLIQFTRERRLPVAIVLFTYGLFLFLDDFYYLGDFIYDNFDIDLPATSSFHFPFLIIIIGLYLLPSIQRKKKRSSVFSEKTDYFQPKKDKKNEEDVPITKPNEVKSTIADAGIKNEKAGFMISERINLTSFKKKIMSEIEYQRGYSVRVLLSKFDLNLGKFTTVDTNTFDAKITGYFSTLVIRVPRNVIVLVNTNSVLSDVIDNRSLLPTSNTTKKCIEIGGKIVCCNLKIEEIE